MKKYIIYLLLFNFCFIRAADKLKENNKIYNYTIEDYVFLHCENICYSITFPNRDAVIVNYPSGLVTLLMNGCISSNFYSQDLLENCKKLDSLIKSDKKKEAFEFISKIYNFITNK